MSVRQIERTLTLELKRKFDETAPRKFDRIYVFKRPFQSPWVRRRWNEMNRPRNITRELTPPLQPEIDMILCEDDRIIAVEIKYFEISFHNTCERLFRHIFSNNPVKKEPACTGYSKCASHRIRQNFL